MKGHAKVPNLLSPLTVREDEYFATKEAFVMCKII